MFFCLRDSNILVRHVQDKILQLYSFMYDDEALLLSYNNLSYLKKVYRKFYAITIIKSRLLKSCLRSGQKQDLWLWTIHLSRLLVLAPIIFTSAVKVTLGSGESRRCSD